MSDPLLHISHLSAGYGPRTVLRDLGLELYGGEILAVIGPNGAGKSTLIRAISGVLPPEQGAITLLGEDGAQLSARERARRVAVVPQAQNLPPAFTGWEVVLAGRTAHANWLGQLGPSDEHAARLALELTHSEALANRLVGQLSGGEQQRLLLARALAQEAPLLLLDEPTAHLDLRYRISLLQELHSLVHDKQAPLAELGVRSGLITLHDLNSVSLVADRVALLVDGTLWAIGSIEEVFDADLLSRAYQVPLEVLQLEDGRRIVGPLLEHEPAS